MSNPSTPLSPVFTLVVMSWQRRAILAALAVLAIVGTTAALWWRSAGPPVVDAGDLVADPRARLGSEVIVTGEWRTSSPSITDPSKGRHIVVVLRGRNGGQVACHFEDVAEEDRWPALEERLMRAPGEVAVRGRCDGVEDGMPVLRGCAGSCQRAWSTPRSARSAPRGGWWR